MMSSLVERLMGSIDLEAITKDVMSKLVISKLEMYFVIHKPHDSEHYELLGMTYGEGSAKKLRDENKKLKPKIIQLHMGKLLKLLEDMGGIEEVE